MDDSNNHCVASLQEGPQWALLPGTYTFVSPLPHWTSVVLWQIEYGRGGGMSFLRLGYKSSLSCFLFLCLSVCLSLSFSSKSQLPCCVQLYGEAHMVRHLGLLPVVTWVSLEAESLAWPSCQMVVALANTFEYNLLRYSKIELPY